jgi:hypothetical protein
MHNANTEFQIAETDALDTDSYGQLLAPSAAWQEIRVLCSHTLPDTKTRPAHRCGSPALRGESFCFYHHPTRAVVRNPHERRARRTARKNFTYCRQPDRPQARQPAPHRPPDRRP